MTSDLHNNERWPDRFKQAQEEFEQLIASSDGPYPAVRSFLQPLQSQEPVPFAVFKALLSQRILQCLRSSSLELIHEDDLEYVADQNAVESTALDLLQCIEVDFDGRLARGDARDPNVIMELVNRLPAVFQHSYRSRLFGSLLRMHYEHGELPREEYLLIAPEFEVEIGKFYADLPMPENEDRTGEMIGDYHVLSQMGKGGLGSVWKAEDVRTGELIAIKFPNENQFEGDWIVQEWLERARINSVVDHVRAVKIREVISKPAAVVMDLHEGEQTLDEFLRDTQRNASEWPSVQDSVRAVKALADTLVEGFHRNDLIHTDLKPANLFVHRTCGALDLLVFDFEFTVSVSQIRDGKTPFPHTRLFDAPELRNDRSPAFNRSTKAETYQLAAILFCLLSGKQANLSRVDLTDQSVRSSIIPETLGDNVLPFLTREVVAEQYGKSLASIYSNAVRTDLESRPDVAQFSAQLDAWLQRNDSASKQERRTPICTYPTPDLGSRFFPRPEVDALIERLKASETFLVLTGPSGTGKSTIATRAATLAVERGLFQSVITVDGTSRETLTDTLLNIADVLGESSSEKPATGPSAVRQDSLPSSASGETTKALVDRAVAALRLTKFQPCLLIIDNLVDEGAFHDLLDRDLTSHGVVFLVTTFRKSLDVMYDDHNRIDVGDLESDDDGAEFILKRALIDDARSSDIEAARQLAGLVGNRVLPLDQLGAWLLSKRRARLPVTVEDLLCEYNSSERAWKLRARRVSRAHGHDASYTATVIMTFSALSQSAQKLVLLSAHFAEAPMPYELFPVSKTDFPGKLSPVAENQAELWDLLEEAWNASLLIEHGSNTRAMHTAVRDVLQDLCAHTDDVEAIASLPKNVMDRHHWQLQARRAVGRYAEFNSKGLGRIHANAFRSSFDVDPPESEYEVLCLGHSMSHETSTERRAEAIATFEKVVRRTSEKRPLVAAHALVMIDQLRIEDQRGRNVGLWHEVVDLIGAAGPSLESESMNLAVLVLYKCSICASESADQSLIDKVSQQLLEATQWDLSKRNRTIVLLRLIRIPANEDFRKRETDSLLQQIRFDHGDKSNAYEVGLLAAAGGALWHGDIDQGKQYLNEYDQLKRGFNNVAFRLAFDIAASEGRFAEAMDLARRWPEELHKEMDSERRMWIEFVEEISHLADMRDDSGAIACLAAEALSMVKRYGDEIEFGVLPELMLANAIGKLIIASNNWEPEIVWRICCGTMNLLHRIRECGSSAEQKYLLLTNRKNQPLDESIERAIGTLAKRGRDGEITYEVCPCGSGKKFKFCEKEKGKDHILSEWKAFLERHKQGCD